MFNKKLIISLILSINFDIANSTQLGDYDSDAKNAAVIPYGKSQDGKTYILFAHEINEDHWTTPGGAREKYHKTILETAVSELYEETAGFPSFNPTEIQLLLKKQPLSCVFTYTDTDIFALNIGNIIDQHDDIGNDYLKRIAEKPSCFHEMNQWKRINVNDLFCALKKEKVFIKTDIIVPQLGTVKTYVFNGLWEFYKAGLEKLILI